MANLYVTTNYMYSTSNSKKCSVCWINSQPNTIYIKYT